MKNIMVFIFIICNTSVVFSQIITHTSPSGGMYVYAEYPGDDEGYHIINVSGEEYIELSIYLEVWDYGYSSVDVYDDSSGFYYGSYSLAGEYIGDLKDETYILIVPNNCYIDMWSMHGALSDIIYNVTDAPRKTMFTYDAAGNRTSRQTMLIDYYSAKKSSFQQIKSKSEIEAEMEENGREFKVYPNPASRNIYVTLNEESIDAPDKRIVLFDYMGRQLLIKEVTSEIEEIDMSELKSGTYILKLIYGNKSEECIIVKH